jgi:hypothetical protein
MADHMINRRIHDARVICVQKDWQNDWESYFMYSADRADRRDDQQCRKFEQTESARTRSTSEKNIGHI